MTWLAKAMPCDKTDTGKHPVELDVPFWQVAKPGIGDSAFPFCSPGIYNGVYVTGGPKDSLAARTVSDFMIRDQKCSFAVFALGAMLLAGTSLAWAQANEPSSPYGGTTVEDIIARVNDQIITQSDYNRSLAELDQEGRQRGMTMQALSASHKDLLRNLIDQQLWLSKGKELNITGETELIKRLDEIRKQYNLETMEDLEKAAKEQGVSFEDFKANIRNQIVTQLVMRQEVGEHIQMTPGEAERYYEEHKKEYSQPESETLSEILIAASSDDTAKLAAAKAKADDIEARLHAGGDFAQLAKSFSDGPTAAQGGDLGKYTAGQNQLSKVIEEKTFALKTGEYTEPILTRQGYIIIKVVRHIAGGPRPYKEVRDEVEQAYYSVRMEPAIRDYLNKMRDEAFIQIKPGYTDTGATYAELHPSIAFSAYVPPAPKKKAKAERTRFRESTHNFRQKPGATATAQPVSETTTPAASKDSKKKTEPLIEKPGKKEKIRYGMAPRATLPTATNDSTTENAGAVQENASTADQPANPLEPTAPTKKSRYSAHAREPKVKTGQNTSQTPALPDAAEVADRQTQAAPLSIAGDNAEEKKKAAAAAAEKTRMTQKKKTDEQKPVQQPTPIPAVPGAPAPAHTPSTSPSAATPNSQTQQ